jgi:uncharacterized membrane protein YhaH (DUF805 family)
MAGSRPPVATSAHPNAGWLSARTVLTSWLVAGSVILAVQQTHRDLHEVHELSPLLHWLRDSALAVPLAALSILVAGSVVRRFRDARIEGASSSLPWRLLYAVLAAVGFAVLSIPGNELHAQLFAAEHPETLGWLEHALRDANAVLDVALLVMLPLALVGAAPWQATGPSIGRLRATPYGRLAVAPTSCPSPRRPQLPPPAVRQQSRRRHPRPAVGTSSRTSWRSTSSSSTTAWGPGTRPA